tara:strand:- start:1160 stop:1942 length:783 start_codon:yes stop_codon:yes gene_type:complete
MTQQAAFLQALFEPTADVPRGFSHPQKERDPAERFSIYRNNVVVSLKQNLADGFPLLLALLGGEAFDALADAFVRAHPPRSPLMFAYGDALPDFVSQFPPFAELPYAADVARLELAMRHAGHARDALAEADLQLSDPDTQGLRLAPCVQLVVSDWPLHDLWTFLDDRTDAPQDMSLSRSLLVYRTQDFDIELVSLPAGGETFLAALMAGKSLSTAGQASPDGRPMKETDMASLLSRLVGAGLVTAIFQTKPEKLTLTEEK